MGIKAEPWQKAEIAGPKKALLVLKPEVVVAMVRKAERPLLIVGHKAATEYSNDVKMIDYAIELSKTGRIPIVATAHMIDEFNKRGLKPLGSMSAMDIGSRLEDPQWTGLDGNGSYDLALFMGLPYYMEFVILSGLKHFSNLKTISLGRFYNPHATWSFPNLSIENWSEAFQTMISKLGGE